MISENPDKIKVSIIQGKAGLAVLLNDYRICGPKPWGGGSVVKEWEVDKIEFELDMKRLIIC